MSKGFSTKERAELVRAVVVGIPTVMVALALKQGVMENVTQLNDWKVQLVVFGLILLGVYYITDKR